MILAAHKAVAHLAEGGHDAGDDAVGQGTDQPVGDELDVVRLELELLERAAHAGHIVGAQVLHHGGAVHHLVRAVNHVLRHVGLQLAGVGQHRLMDGEDLIHRQMPADVALVHLVAYQHLGEVHQRVLLTNAQVQVAVVHEEDVRVEHSQLDEQALLHNHRGEAPQVGLEQDVVEDVFEVILVLVLLNHLTGVEIFALAAGGAPHRPVLLHRRQLILQLGGQPQVIVIQERHVIAHCPQRAVVACRSRSAVFLAEVAQFGGVVRGNDILDGLFGSVVHQQHLKALVRLRQDGINGLVDKLAGVVAGSEDGNNRARAHGFARSPFSQPPFGAPPAAS